MIRLAALVLAAFTLAADEPKKAEPVQYVKDMADTDFTKRTLDRLDYSKYNLENCKFHFCSMVEMKLVKANLRGADFGSASLTKSDLTGANLQNAKFDSASVQESIFNDADLSGADMSKGSAQMAKFVGANLSNLKGLKDMTGADFTNANLCGANLQDTNEYATKAIFKGAKYDKLTKWPRGYDVEKSGAILVETPEKK